MPWLSPTLTHLQEAKAAAIVEAARNISLADGQGDPVPGSIAAVVGRIQTAVRVGNPLDLDRSKIPAELLDLAVRMIVRRLKGRVEEPLTQAEEQEAREDQSYLNRIMDNRVRFDPPDNPDVSTVQAASPSPAVARPWRRFTGRAEDGL